MMTICEIKKTTAQTSPYFFSRKTLKYFGQTIKMFSVRKHKGGKFIITAPIFDRLTGRRIGDTTRIFNPETNQLENI